MVYAWVMAGGTRYPDEDIEPWLQSVAATFDGTPTRHRVPARVSDYERRRALSIRGIREAERLHNLKSHPNAPIFGVK